MTKTICIKIYKVAIVTLLMLSLAACSQTTPVPPTQTLDSTNTSTPNPTATSAPTNTPIPTNTNTPEPTPIPGKQVFPLASLESGIPWLPLDEAKRPMSVYYGFNVSKPPFNNEQVRKAFAAAIDREQIAQEASGFNFREVTPATSLTPSQTLGRDLYGEVGIPFNPALAKEYLEEAGYNDVSSFPTITLIVSTRGEAAPGAYFRMAQSIVDMWKTHLGINVEIEVVGNMGQYINRLETDPPHIYQLGWGADYNDPDNFLKTLFHSTSEFNFGLFKSVQFDSLVDRAANLSDPEERLLLYINAEKILTEAEVGVIPLFHTLYYQQP